MRWKLHFTLPQVSMECIWFSKPSPGLGRLRVVGLASQLPCAKTQLIIRYLPSRYVAKCSTPPPEPDIPKMLWYPLGISTFTLSILVATCLHSLAGNDQGHGSISLAYHLYKMILNLLIIISLIKVLLKQALKPLPAMAKTFNSSSWVGHS